MDKFIDIGMKLHHRYFSDIYVIKIDNNSIKANTKTHGPLEFSIEDIGKTIYINKSDLNYTFETPESYIKYLEEEMRKVNLEKDRNTILVELSKLQDKKLNEEFLDCKYYEIPQKFILYKNKYLKHNVDGYFHQYYTGYKNHGNPDFLNILKNTFNSTSHKELIYAQNKVISIIKKDIENIMRVLDEKNYLCMCVPRAKALSEYSRWQLMFIEAVSHVAQKTKGLIDGTEYIVRYKNTRTTHLRNVLKDINDGPLPYPGITKNTCNIHQKKIKDKKIILIDDIYTKNVNIDEDCIQALFDNGAKKVIFYAIGYTRRF